MNGEHKHGGFKDSEQTEEDVSELLDPAAEKRLVRKVDIRLIPILFALYLCAFLDRVNIGNARIQGLEADLGMTGEDYNIALFVFFVPYILFEVPSNMLLKNIRPSWYLTGIIASWGVVTVGMGLTRTFHGLVACRFLLGLFEAGFFPGCAYLISMYYCRLELQVRMNVFFCASITAGAVSGLLAYGIAHMDGVANYAGWRWIFILEGIATILAAGIGFFIIPDWPDSAKFLTEEERILLIQRLSRDTEGVTMNRLDKKAAKRVFSDPKIYFGIFIFIGVVTTTYSIVFFAPTILKQLGWTSVRAQIMSIPIFVVAAIFTLVSAVLSDRMKKRYVGLMSGGFVALVGYILLLNMMRIPVGARYFALFLTTGGGFTAQTISIVRLSNNLGGHYKRAIGMGMQIGFGNVSGIIASFIYRAHEAPTYHTGFGTGLGLLGFGMIAATALYFYLRSENAARDAGKRDYMYNLPSEEVDNLGDDDPRFRFIL